MDTDEQIRSNRRAIAHKDTAEIISLRIQEENKVGTVAKSHLWIACEQELYARNQRDIERRHKQSVWIAAVSAVIAVGSMIAALLSAIHAGRQADAADAAAQHATALSK